MQPQWTRDIAIDASLAAAVIGAQFPALRRATVEPFGSGWDNAAFLVDGRFVFRFPVRRIAAPLIEREIAVLLAHARDRETPGTGRIISEITFVSTSVIRSLHRAPVPGRG